MSNKRSPRSMDPHGYVPVYVNEDVLTPAERREVLIEAIGGLRQSAVGDRNWAGQLTSRERQELETARNVKLPFAIYADESPVLREKRGELAVVGTLRANARRQHSGGHPIGYGDSITCRSPTG
jgi:hypothetical protein